MKIGVILPHFLLFGGVRRYIELGNRFVRRGHDFTVFTPDGVPPVWMRFEGKVLRLDEMGGRKHDVMITGTPEYKGYLDDSGAAVKVFYLQMEDIKDEKEIVCCGRYRIMVNSSGLAERVRRLYSVETLDGRGGVDCELFHPSPADEVGAKDLSGEDRFRILCYGRLSRPRKGTRFVVGASRRIFEAGHDVELQLFDSRIDGDEDPRAGFQPGLPFRYYLDLPQERMPAVYNGADVFVSAERRAGWSNTSAEAAACGLPLVCTRSGTEDFAVDGETAVIIPRRNTRSIARAILSLRSDGQKTRMMGKLARARVLEFTWDRVCDRMESTFGKMID